jgi:hypothetical protein
MHANTLNGTNPLLTVPWYPVGQHYVSIGHIGSDQKPCARSESPSTITTALKAKESAEHNLSCEWRMDGLFRYGEVSEECKDTPCYSNDIVETAKHVDAAVFATFTRGTRRR